MMCLCIANRIIIYFIKNLSRMPFFVSGEHSMDSTAVINVNRFRQACNCPIELDRLRNGRTGRNMARWNADFWNLKDLLLCLKILNAYRCLFDP